MVIFSGSRTIGRYGSSNITANFRRDALALFRSGVGVTQSRALLREQGYRFSNNAMTALGREFREIRNKGAALNSIRNDARPTRRTISQTQMRFKRQYQYSGTVTLKDINGIRQEVAVNFSSDTLHTGGEIRERFQATGESVALRGGINYELEEPEIERVSITGLMRGLPSIDILGVNTNILSIASR